MHVGKTEALKPSIFSHVYLKGCSIQRHDIATTLELVSFASKFLDDNKNQAWKGVLLAKCDDLRNIKVGGTSKRSVCAYDTAEKENPAHGEIGQTQYIIEEADKNELRHDLITAFGNGNIIQPILYRSGTVWNNLPQNLQTR